MHLSLLNTVDFVIDYEYQLITIFLIRTSNLLRIDISIHWKIFFSFILYDVFFSLSLSLSLVSFCIDSTSLVILTKFDRFVCVSFDIFLSFVLHTYSYCWYKHESCTNLKRLTKRRENRDYTLTNLVTGLRACVSIQITSIIDDESEDYMCTNNHSYFFVRRLHALIKVIVHCNK
jgi:hypothetical protein